MKKSILAASLLLATGSVSAAPFYLDAGTNFDGVIAPGADKVCDTCTSMKNEFTVTYESQTTVTDLDANGIDAGDSVSTDAGLAVGSLTNNQINGFLPNESFGSNSNNGYGSSNWLISFSITGLNGVVSGINDQGDLDPTNDVTLLDYGPGLLQLYITFDGSTFNNFMDVAIKGGHTDGVGTSLVGSADFTNVDAGYNDLFHSGDHKCLGSDAFIDIWSNCGEGAGTDLAINFVSHFDTGIFVTDFSAIDQTHFLVTSNHDGSGTFSVPEPGTLALLGGSLLMMGRFARRKQA
jgi:hypothetical protein